MTKLSGLASKEAKRYIAPEFRKKETWQYLSVGALPRNNRDYSPALAALLIQLIALDKAIDATFGVDDLLLSGIERVAGAADFYTNLVFG